MLKTPLVCWHCGAEQKNMPVLKSHLQREWDALAERAREGEENS